MRQQQREQLVSAFGVMLEDFMSSGITDAASDDPFDFSSGAIKAPDFSLNSVPAPKDSVHSLKDSGSATTIQPQEVVSEEAATNATPFDAASHVWKYGQSSADIVIVVGSRQEVGSNPFNGDSYELFCKMMKAIDLDAASLSFVAMKEACAKGRILSDSRLKKVSQIIEKEVVACGAKSLLVVGQESCRAMFASPLASVRNDNVKFASLPAVAVCHPAMLLKQSALKRMAWQDLLKFKVVVDNLG